MAPTRYSTDNPQPTLFSHPSIRHHCLATLKGHTSYISSLTLSDKFLFTGSSDSQIRSWTTDLTDNVPTNGKCAVKSIVVSADKLFTAHQDHKIRVWRINEHDRTCTHLATLPTLADRAAKLLLPKNHVSVRRHKKSTWVHHVDAVSALALSRDHSLLYSVSWDRALKIWRTSDFKCLESVPHAHDDAINALALSGDGHVYTGSADKKIKKWEKRPGEKRHSLVGTLEKHESGVNALALTPDGSVLYSGGSDRAIVVWEEEEGGGMVVAGGLRGHEIAVLCLAVVEDLLCSGSADKTVRVWRGWCCVAVLEGHGGPVKCLTARVRGSDSGFGSYLVYSGGLDCDVKIWQIYATLM